MKILSSLPSLIGEEQAKNLNKFIMKQANLNSIVWEDVLEDTIKDLSEFQLDKTLYSAKFKFEKFEGELENIFINTLALMKEDSLITDIISKHEMIRKDEVKSINDISKRSIDIITGSDDRSYQKNIMIKNDIMSLLPSNVQYYEPSNVSVLYYPSSLEYIIGSVPNTTEIKSGTFSGYWAADIYTNNRTDVGAEVILEFAAPILFNNINLRGASTHPLDIQSVEYYNAGSSSWVDITPADLEYSKDFYLTYNTTYTTKRIKINVKQPHYDYVWKKEVDDSYLIRNTIITGRDITRIKNNRIEKVITDKPLELISRSTIGNKFRYEVGAYNIQVFLKTFINEDGIFRSKAFKKDDVINDIKITSTNNALGTILYKAIYEDESYIEYSGSDELPLNTKIPVDKTWYKVENFTNLQYNRVKLEHHPYVFLSATPALRKEVVLKVDGKLGTYVDEFTYGTDLEFIVSGDNIYTNKSLDDSIISVGYWKKTSSVILEVILNTNQTGYSFFSPEADTLNIEINGEKV